MAGERAGGVLSRGGQFPRGSAQSRKQHEAKRNGGDGEMNPTEAALCLRMHAAIILSVWTIITPIW